MFKKYKRSQIAELRPYIPGEDITGISISQSDLDAGSPRLGDMIARNPKDHGDQWLVAAQYFRDNFDPADAAPSPAPEAQHERPSEQAVTEALTIAHEALEAARDQILESYRTWVADDKDAKPRYGQYPRYDQVNAAIRVVSEALTAAQEEGR